MADNKKGINVNSSPFKAEGGGTPFLESIGTPLGIALSLGSSIFGAISARKQEKRAARKAKKRALAEQKKAQAEMDRRTKEFEAQDTSNIYKDVRNPYEN